VAKKEPDASEVVESPTMDEVKGEEEVKTEAPSIEDGLKPLTEMLEAHGIKSPEDIESLVGELSTYKKEYGDSRNEIGELRRQIEILQQVKKGSEFDPEYSSDNSVDLRKVVKDVLGEFYSEQQKNQQIAEESYWSQRTELESRPNWGKVQQYFDKALQNPSIRSAMKSGKMTMESLYSRLNERLLMSTLDNFVKTLPDDVKLSQATPDVSTSDRVVADVPADVKRKDDRKKAVENKDVDGVLKTMFADDDPILRY